MHSCDFLTIAASLLVFMGLAKRRPTAKQNKRDRSSNVKATSAGLRSSALGRRTSAGLASQRDDILRLLGFDPIDTDDTGDGADHASRRPRYKSAQILCHRAEESRLPTILEDIEPIKLGAQVVGVRVGRCSECRRLAQEKRLDGRECSAEGRWKGVEGPLQVRIILVTQSLDD